VSETILSTKLFIPNLRNDHVPRHHLVGALNAGKISKLILISAPAGFGKTTIICEWINRNEVPSGWITLDENDNDPGRFLTYLAASLDSIGIKTDFQPLNIIQNSGSVQIEPVLNNIINQITETRITFCLVFDDYHHISNQDVHHIVSYLLENLRQSVSYKKYTQQVR